MLDSNGQIDCNWCMVFMHFELKDGAKQNSEKKQPKLLLNIMLGLETIAHTHIGNEWVNINFCIGADQLFTCIAVSHINLSLIIHF